jgi:hypothetical protein
MFHMVWVVGQLAFRHASWLFFLPDARNTEMSVGLLLNFEMVPAGGIEPPTKGL